MKFSLLRTCCAAWWLLCIGHYALAQSTSKAAPSNAPAVVSTQAQQLFAKYKDRLVQVRVLLNSASEQSSLGSAFVVRDAGSGDVWLLTNYHVVSALAMEPSTYRIELRTHDNRTVAAQLMAIDVVHDLAVLRTQAAPDRRGGAWPSFALRSQKPKQGEKVYALGNPLELGFLISEGTYNGLVESRLYEQMLFSGALNSGMSGGPAIDATGQVVGVNVATRRDGESLSFLVPIHYAVSLLNKAYQTPTAPKAWRGEIAAHLLTHQELITNTILAAPINSTSTLPKGLAVQTLAGRTVLSTNPSLTKCWAKTREDDSPKYLRDNLSCDLKSSVYVTNNVRTGMFSLSYTVLRNQTLDAAQFLLAPTLNSRNYGAALNHDKDKTGGRCEDHVIQGKQHRYRLKSCLTGYKKFDGLYDLNVRAVQVDDPHERLTGELSLNGFGFDNAQRIARYWTEQLQ